MCTLVCTLVCTHITSLRLHARGTERLLTQALCIYGPGPQRLAAMLVGTMSSVFVLRMAVLGAVTSRGVELA